MHAVVQQPNKTQRRSSRPTICAMVCVLDLHLHHTLCTLQTFPDACRSCDSCARHAQVQALLQTHHLCRDLRAGSAFVDHVCLLPRPLPAGLRRPLCQCAALFLKHERGMAYFGAPCGAEILCKMMRACFSSRTLSSGLLLEVHALYGFANACTKIKCYTKYLNFHSLSYTQHMQHQHMLADQRVRPALHHLLEVCQRWMGELEQSIIVLMIGHCLTSSINFCVPDFKVAFSIHCACMIIMTIIVIMNPC